MLDKKESESLRVYTVHEFSIKCSHRGWESKDSKLKEIFTFYFLYLNIDMPILEHAFFEMEFWISIVYNQLNINSYFCRLNSNIETMILTFCGIYSKQ